MKKHFVNQTYAQASEPGIPILYNKPYVPTPSTL